ncbi:jg15942 [Pararge aegeria aegeria]|uniref:Jg15942 protein n=1 Tax=Pararge aegeria aegeria TaxID=348720 RepID=A0A8S4S501_9NEOP|nr:jg15942 [Pararge aegeria aegeria]
MNYAPSSFVRLTDYTYKMAYFMVQLKADNVGAAVRDLRAQVPGGGAEPGVLRPPGTAAAEAGATTFQGLEG